MTLQATARSAEHADAPAHRSQLHPRTEPPAGVSPFLHLQRTVGNQAVLRMKRDGVSGEKPGSGRSAALTVRDVVRSPGRPLDPATRAFMEPRFGRGFGGVRVHADAPAAASARSLGARAYTAGAHVVFAPGEYRPGAPEGTRLIAHELAHVVQQSGGGGGPPGRAQERDAEAASAAVAAGERPRVRASSGVGFAAQPAVCTPSFGRVGDLAGLTWRMERIVGLPGIRWSYTYATRGFSVSRTKLETTQFASEEDRLLYLRAVIETELTTDRPGSWEESQALGYHPPSPAAVVAEMVAYEVERLQAQAEEALPAAPAALPSCPAAPGPADALGFTAAGNARAAEQDRREYESYLAEVARLRDLDEQERHKPIVYSGAATVGLYESYVGAPVKAVAQSLVQRDTRQMVSLMVNFIPIVGQVKAVAEAIVGYDLITREELPTWERGLNLLLAIIPEAHGIFTSGEAGLRTLARVAVDSARPVDEVFHATKAASRITVEEVQAAEKLAAGAHPTPAQLRLAAKLEGLPGATAKSAARQTAATGAARGTKAALAVTLEQLTQPVKLAGKSHALSLRRVGNQFRVWLCSNNCGELIAKLEGMLGRLPARHGARAELETLLENARKEATWIDLYPAGEEAQRELQKLRTALEDIERRHPGVVDPDLPVASAAPAPAPAPKPTPRDAAAAHFDDLEPTGPLKPKQRKPRGGEELGGKASMAENFAKAELENSGWLRRRLPDAEQRRRFMKYLEEGHFGEHGHLTPETEAANRILEAWASGEPKVNLRPRR